MNDCKHEAGLFVPVINRNRCEGKGPCEPVCPYGVLAIQTLPREQRSELTLVGKIKGMAHGWQQAFVVQPDLCEACGLCVAA